MPSRVSGDLIGKNAGADNSSKSYMIFRGPAISTALEPYAISPESAARNQFLRHYASSIDEMRVKAAKSYFASSRRMMVIDSRTSAGNRRLSLFHFEP